MNLDTKKPGHIFYILAIAIFLLAGIYLRSYNLAGRGLEYDEIWTVNHYADQSIKTIFRQLDVPNNHPLHSLGVYLTQKILGTSPFAIRLTSFISGLLLLLLLPLILLIAKKPLPVVFLATAWLAFSPHLVHYGQTARGYSLQILLIFIHCSCLFSCYQKRNIYLYIIAALAGILSVLTLATSVLYLLPAVLLHIYYLWRSSHNSILACINKHRAIFIVHIIVMVFALLWILLNYHQLSQGSQHGITITSLDNWQKIIIAHGEVLFFSPLAFFILVAIIRRERLYAAIFGWITCFVIITLPLVKAGPPRVYMFLLPFFYIAAAEGVYALRLGGQKFFAKAPIFPILALVLALLPVLAYQQKIQRLRPIDWSRTVLEVEEAFVYDTYIVYPAFAGYQIKYHFPEMTAKTLRRLPRSTNHFLAVCDKVISGSHLQTGEIVRHKIAEGSLAENISGVSLSLLHLRQLTKKDMMLSGEQISGIVVLAIGPAISAKVSAVMRELDLSWVWLNPFLQDHFIGAEGRLLWTHDPITDTLLRILNHSEARLYIVEKHNP